MVGLSLLRPVHVLLRLLRRLSDVLLRRRAYLRGDRRLSRRLRRGHAGCAAVLAQLDERLHSRDERQNGSVLAIGGPFQDRLFPAQKRAAPVLPLRSSAGT